MKIKDYLGVIGLIVAIGSLILGMYNYNLNVANQNLQLESLRADVNVFIEPIANQNWTFTSDGVFLEVNGLLFNEGARTTQIEKAELSLTFQFPGGGEYTMPPIQSNITKDFVMEEYIIEEGGKRGFTITYFIMKHMVLNDETGEVMNVGDVKPVKVELTIWHNDNIGEKIGYGESY